MSFFARVARKIASFYAGLSFRCDLPVFHRNFLPSLLPSFGLDGVGAEIGVARGDFSAIILRNSNLRLLYSVDSWSGDRFKNYPIAMNKLSCFKGRSVIMKNASEDASASIKDASLDFIYIDASHDYEAVLQDLGLWWPKLKKGGIFSGHDYIDGSFPEGNFGVKKAVDIFLSDKSHGRLFIVPWKWPTWYCVKK